MNKGHIDVVEDDESLLSSITNLLTFVGYSVRGWQNASRFLDNLPQTAPAVVVTDMRMPELSGLDLHNELIARGRSMPVIYISGESTAAQSISAMKLGAMDFLIKPFTREDLLRAVAAGIEKDRIQMQKIIDQARFEEAVSQLSPRERQVLDLLLQGFNNTEILQSLHISLPTAKQYKTQLMRKLNVRSLSELFKLSASLRVNSNDKT